MQLEYRSDHAMYGVYENYIERKKLNISFYEIMIFFVIFYFGTKSESLIQSPRRQNDECLCEINEK